VYEGLTKGGHAICRCGFDDQRNDRSLEVPAWMFEPAACDHLRLTATPFVDCQALIEVKTLFHPPPPRPHFQRLPPDIQERTIRLLARLLRRQADQPLVSGEAWEARDE
jgi:hypothetical protein